MTPSGTLTTLQRADGKLYGTSIDSGSSGGGDASRVTLSATTPSVDWAKPADIVYGTPLGAAQLAAAASVPGTFTYSPPSGTLLSAGSDQRLSATFTPNDTGNYSTTTLSVSINVLPAPLTITADDKTREVRLPMPLLTASYSGFVNGETPAVLAASVVLATTATEASPPGTYPIVPSGADAANYAITFVNGTLTIVVAAPGPPSRRALVPLLGCVRSDGPKAYTAFFGYRSLSTAPLAVAVGPGNSFWPAPVDRGQPTVFQPGQADLRLFSVPFDGKNLSWTLVGSDGRPRTATASSSSKRCSPP